MTDRSSNRDPFYVGYLPMPEEHRRFVHALVVLLALWILGVGATIAMVMRDPGDAVWNTSNEQSWTGTLTMHPYPMLIPDNDRQHPLLIVSIGKRGAHDRLAEFDRSTVELHGWELHREGRHLIELAEEDDAIIRVDDASPLSAPGRPAEQVTIEGEIVDGKCFLGAMKPGDGSAHKSCAVLCLRGELPPMLATADVEGDPVFHLLIVDGKTALSEQILQLVSKRVRIRGQLTQPFDGLSILSTTEQEITPTQ